MAVLRAHSSTWSCVAIFILSVVLSDSPLLAQGGTGRILGTAVDSSGAAVAGVAVRVINQGTGESRAGVSDQTGSYIFPSLPVGVYRIEAEASGFKKFIREGVILEVDRNATVDVLLQVGQVSETLTVTGDASLVDTHQVQTGALLDSRRALDLPINGRNIYTLASILPGVAAANTETVSTRVGTTMNVNGGRGKNNLFLLDGGFNTTHWRGGGDAAPNPDAIQEFRAITNNFNAEYGRSSGSVISVVTKSGTNELHGGAYEFLRNDRLNVREVV